MGRILVHGNAGTIRSANCVEKRIQTESRMQLTDFPFCNLRSLDSFMAFDVGLRCA